MIAEHNQAVVVTHIAARVTSFRQIQRSGSMPSSTAVPCSQVHSALSIQPAKPLTFQIQRHSDGDSRLISAASYGTQSLSPPLQRFRIQPAAPRDLQAPAAATPATVARRDDPARCAAPPRGPLPAGDHLVTKAASHGALSRLPRRRQHASCETPLLSVTCTPLSCTHTSLTVLRTRDRF